MRTRHVRTVVRLDTASTIAPNSATLPPTSSVAFVAMLATWPGIVPTDSVGKIGATATAPLLELLASPLVSSNLQIPNSTTSCKNWVLVAPSLEPQLLLASKLVVMIVEQPSLGSVDLPEDQHPGRLVGPVVVVSAMLPVLEDLHLGQPVDLVEVARTTAMEAAATAVITLQAVPRHGSSSNSRAMHHLNNNKVDTEAGTVDMVVVMAERQATNRATTRDTDKQQHLAWHHGNSKHHHLPTTPTMHLLRHRKCLLHLHLSTLPLPQALERDWQERPVGIATKCR
jgi:hypothetical protein